MDRSIQHDAPGLQAPPPALPPATVLGAGQQAQLELGPAGLKLSFDAPTGQAGSGEGAHTGADAVSSRDSSAEAAPPAVTPPAEPPTAPARKVPSWLKPRGKGAAAAVAGGEVPSWVGRAGRKGRIVQSPRIAPAAAVEGVARAMARGGRSARGGAVAAGCVATASAMVAAGISPTVLPKAVSQGVGSRLRWWGGSVGRSVTAGAWLAKVLGERVGLRWFVRAAVAVYGRGARKAVRRKGRKQSGGGKGEKGAA